MAVATLGGDRVTMTSSVSGEAAGAVDAPGGEKGLHDDARGERGYTGLSDPIMQVGEGVMTVSQPVGGVLLNICLDLRFCVSKNHPSPQKVLNSSGSYGKWRSATESEGEKAARPDR